MNSGTLFIKNTLLICICFFGIITNNLFAQTKAKATGFKIPKAASYSFYEIKDDFAPTLQNTEMPHPNSERGRLIELKKEIRKKYPLKANPKKNEKSTSDSTPSPFLGFSVNGNIYNNRVPNDNNIAISNNGKIISVINSTLWSYDAPKDSFEFSKTLASIASPLGLSHSKYDPKVIYDPITDKFILVFLNGNLANNSYILVGFSNSNDPKDGWNMYKVPGNPFNDTTWSDYPAIAITEKELFITINLLKENEPWQTGFVQTVVWQINKQSGYDGAEELNSKLWSDIKFGGKSIRNINPIGGGRKPFGPDIYLLSNRNFDIQNDTIFLLKISNTLDDSTSELTIKALKSDKTYGAPPVARQAGGQEFDTNDGRILGGFFENERIQFVNNTIDTITGFAGVYHGVISSLDSVPVIHAQIIGDDIKDFGYPNISYSGKQACDNESIISFEHSSPTDFAGLSAIFYSNNGQYSDVTDVKKGLNYVDDFIAAPYNRWGDYSGSQRKYNEPGRVWISGNYGAANKNNATWIAELISPDSAVFSINEIYVMSPSVYLGTNGSISVSISGGNLPYTYSWNDALKTSDTLLSNVNSGVYTLTATDSYNCTISKTFEISQPEPQNTLFPNPAVDAINLSFILEENSSVKAAIYDFNGKLVKEIFEDYGKKGHNLFSFSTQPLSHGTYLVKLTADNKIIISQKFVKLEQ